MKQSIVAVTVGVLSSVCVLVAPASAKTPAVPRFGLERSLQIRQAQVPNDGEVHVVPVQGHIYMLVGAGGNIAVQIGDEGVLVVDTGTAQMSEKVLAAIKKLSDKPLRYIINTHFHSDHTGGNVTIGKAGSTTRGGAT